MGRIICFYERDTWISHGGISHPASESKTCKSCIQTQAEFDEAIKNGLLDKLIGEREALLEKTLVNNEEVSSETS